MAGKFTQTADDVVAGIGLIREGGPAAVYGAQAIRAYDEFAGTTRA